MCIFISSGKCSRARVLCCVITACLVYWETDTLFCRRLYSFAFPPAGYEPSSFSTSLPGLGVVAVFYFTILTGVRYRYDISLWPKFAYPSDVQHLFMCLFITWNPLWWNVSLSFDHFVIGFAYIFLFIFLLLRFESFIYIQEKSPLSQHTSFCILFSLTFFLLFEIIKHFYFLIFPLLLYMHSFILF